MLTELADDPHVWDSVDKGKFALWGSIFTIGMDAAIYPLESLKTRLQVETKVRPSGGCSRPARGRHAHARDPGPIACRPPVPPSRCRPPHHHHVSAPPPHPPHLQSKATLFEAVWRTTRSALQTEGVRGLYRGFSMFTFGGLPSQGCVLDPRRR